MAIIIDLGDSHKIKRLTTLLQSGSNYQPTIKIPLHVTSGNDDWDTTLHAIRYFYHLSPEDQNAEIAKKFTPLERQLLRANRQRLMDDKPPPLSSNRLPSVGITDRQSEKQRQDLISMSAERCKSSNGAKIAAKILAQPKYGIYPAKPQATSVLQEVNVMSEEGCNQTKTESVVTMASSVENTQQETMAEEQCNIKPCNNPLDALPSLASLDSVNVNTNMSSMDTSTATEAGLHQQENILTEDDKYNAKIDVFLESRCFVAELPLGPIDAMAQSPSEVTDDIQLTYAQLAIVVDVILQHSCFIRRK